MKRGQYVLAWVLLAVVMIVFLYCSFTSGASGASEPYTPGDIYSRLVGQWTNWPDNSPDTPSPSNPAYTLILNPEPDNTGLDVGPQIWGVLNISTGETNETINFTSQIITESVDQTVIYLHLNVEVNPTADTQYVLMVPSTFNPTSTSPTGQLLLAPSTDLIFKTLTFSPM